MKKILFLLLVAVCAIVACNPVHEDVSNGGHITADELIAKSTVVVDKVVKIAEKQTHTATAGTPIVLAKDVDVKDCESVVLYFGEAIADTCWEVSINGAAFERIPKNVSMYRSELANKVTNGVVSSIALKHIKDTESNTITVKSIYKTFGRHAAPNKDGQYGNVIYCQTSAPVNAKWDIGGKEFVGNYASKKMNVKWDEKGDYVNTPYTVVLTALCADGTEVKANFSVQCDEISNPLIKYYIYGDPNRSDEEKADKPQEPFTYVATGDAAPGRFSDNEGKYLPYIPDDVYYGKKTLIFEITDVKEGNHIWGAGWGPAQMRIMTGWWSPVFADNVEPKVGLWELPLTQEMAEWCAHGNPDKDGEVRSRDLTLLMTRGSITIKSVYYEE